MEKRNVNGLFRKDTNCKDMCVNLSAHQGRFTVEEALINQVDKTTRSVGGKQPLSPDTEDWMCLLNGP